MYDFTLIYLWNLFITKKPFYFWASNAGFISDIEDHLEIEYISSI